MTFNIFCCCYLNTAILILLSHNSFAWSNKRAQENDKSDFLIGPYSEFDSDWYLRIGTALIFAQGAMLVFPHIFTLMQSIMLCMTRCIDRRFSWNTKKTSKIIQSEYEDLYTGPEFILHVRYAQVLSTIFVTLTYSSGIPGLYALNFVILFVQYWVDKWLVFNYYKKTPYFTAQLSKSVVDLLPWGVLLHALFGYIIYSYPYIFRSSEVEWFGTERFQYFTPKRFGQVHIIAFFIITCIILLIFLFEKNCVKNFRKCYGKLSFCCGNCCAKMNGREYDPTDYSN